jgi:hypothetical protein
LLPASLTLCEWFLLVEFCGPPHSGEGPKNDLIVRDDCSDQCLCGNGLRSCGLIVDSSTGVVPVTSLPKLAPTGTR